MAFCRRRFENSLDMVAARPELSVGLVSSPSSTDSAWSMLESPVLGLSPNVVRFSEITNRQVQPLRLPRKAAPAVPVAPLNIKKMRRRGLVSGITLVLPASPLPLATPGLSAGLTPQTSFTFTADWDANERGFLFTPLCEAPPTAFSPRTPAGPVPDDIEEEPVSAPADVVSRRPASPTPSSASSASSVFSDSASLFMHGRKASTASTAPSSIFPEPEPEIKSAPQPSPVEDPLRMVEAELERVAPLPKSEAFDKSCLMMLDDELLRNPWQAMTSLCWESVDEPVARRPVPRLSYRNKIADVPADTAQSGDFNLGEARLSRFSSDALTLASAVPQQCHHLRFHFGKAFRFPRRASE